MPAKTICFGIQKGGCGKSTTTGVTAHILSAELDKRVLVIDMDSQGNQTELLTTSSDIYEYDGKTIFEALKEGNAKPYIVPITDNLHLIPANDLLATFTFWLYHEGKTIYPEHTGSHLKALRNILDPLRDDYDYILIDTPPALGEQTLNALSASDFVVILFETSKFCYSAVSRFMESIEYVQGLYNPNKAPLNPNLKIAGILRNLNDSRRSDMRAMIQVVEEEFPNLVFDTVIDRTAAVGRLALTGFGEDNKELKKSIEPYRSFVQELLKRVHQ